MRELAIQISALGKMYRLYRHPADRVLDALDLNRLLFWRRNQYEAFWALRNVNLEVQRGERLGIIGRNGAGKSTLLKIITGNVAPSEGTVEVQGRIEALLELGTGFHPEFTGRENIRAALSYHGLATGRIRELQQEIEDFAELDTFIEQPVKTYSAGMYARLAFSVATAIEPEVLIVDEVLGAGDAYFASKCIERMKSLTRDGTVTVLFVSHDLGGVQQLCDRVLWIDRGQITSEGKPVDVVKQYYASILAQEEARLRARNAQRSTDGESARQPNGAPSNGGELVLQQRSTDKFYSEFAEFKAVEILDQAGQRQVVFRPGETLRISIETTIKRPIPACEFTIAIYTLTNEVVASLTWPVEKDLPTGTHHWETKIEQPNLRQNEYVISAALIQTSPEASNEPTTFLCRWNRSLSFRIEEGRIANKMPALVLLKSDPPAGSPLSATNMATQQIRSDTVAAEDTLNDESNSKGDIPEPAVFRQQLIDALGQVPNEGTPAAPVYVEETHVYGVTLKEFRYENVFGETVGLTVAEPARRRWDNPVIAIHQTNDAGRREVFGLAEDSDLEFGLSLAERGHRVFAIDLFLTGDRSPQSHWDYQPFYAEYPRWSMLGKMIQDLQDLVHVMRHAFHERERINCIGHSMGGVLGYYFAALCPYVMRSVCNAAYDQTPDDTNPWGAQIYELRVLNPDVGGLCLAQHTDLLISLASIHAELLLLCYRSDTILRARFQHLVKSIA